MRFTSRVFRRKISRKRSGKKAIRKTRKVRRASQRGGNTFDRSISPYAKLVNPLIEND